MKIIIPPDKNIAGFTLIENVVALVIISIALLGLISTTVVIIKANSFSKMMTEATTLAQDKMEQLRNMSYANVSSGGPETVNSNYSRSWTVTADSPATDMQTVVVTVTWSWLGMNHNVTINNIIAR